MLRRRGLASLLFIVGTLAAAPPAPVEHFGYTPGDDYKLADSGEIYGYFRKLAAESGRIRVMEIGQSEGGKPIQLAFISSEENLRGLERWKGLNRRMALGEATKGEAGRLATEGRTVVWIDCGLHSTEVAPPQHAPHLAYRMVTGETEEIRRIREKVILLVVPIMNPDGHDMVAEWYRGNVGTPHELAPLPKLYHKYAGHDNNRDWFMMNLKETRHVSRMLYEEWFPQIVYNQHQTSPFPSRIFIPPYAEPLNPAIPAPVMNGIGSIGAAMRERFSRENKPGAISYVGFDAWWNGGARSTPAFHNMHGILTETALYGYATPGEYTVKDFPARFANGMPTREPSIFYDRPWMGGRWRLMDAVEYILTSDFALLDHAARNSDHYLMKAWEMARANIEAGNAGGPFAYVVPPDQHDAWSAREMLWRLQAGGLRVEQAKAAFTADGREYPAGTFVLPAGQAFRSYLMDLMEPQKYPEIRLGQTGPTKRPYDVAGWTLPLQMGVKVERVEDRFQAQLESVEKVAPGPLTLDARQNGSFIAAARRLKEGQALRRAADGAFVTPEQAGFGQAKWELKAPRVALYEPHTSNMDAGWTQWVLDNFEVPYTLAKNEDLRAANLRAKYDVVILAAQSVQGILHGFRAGERSTRPNSAQRPEYTGGLGVEGVERLQEFVRAGGTLIAFDQAADLPMEMFPIGVRGTLRGAGSWYSPGSLLRVKVDTKHPLALGMPEEAVIMTTGGQAFEVTLSDEANRGERAASPVVWYAKKDLLASGWVTGEGAVTGKPAMVEARMGAGRVVLFGFRTQFRAQSFGTFKLLLNAIYLGAAREL
jgi:hypothetical protein